MARAPKPVVFDEPGTDDASSLDAIDNPMPEATTQVSDEKLQELFEELAMLRAAAQARPATIKVQKQGDFVPEVRPVIKPQAVKRIRIILEDNEAIPPTGLFISPNGNPYLLMPSVEADVPITVINVLNDAVTEVPVVDPMTQRVIGYRKRLRFPYQVVNRVAA
jgi:hypothetical protein